MKKRFADEQVMEALDALAISIQTAKWSNERKKAEVGLFIEFIRSLLRFLGGLWQSVTLRDLVDPFESASAALGCATVHVRNSSRF